jgi:hypothetical protein
MLETFKNKLKNQKTKIKSHIKKEFNDKNKFKKSLFGFCLTLTTLPILASIYIGIIFKNPELISYYKEDMKLEKYEGSIYNKRIKEFENTILTRDGILTKKVSKEDFKKELINQTSKKYKVKKYVEFLINEIKENLNYVNEGMFFINKDNDNIELIATDNNGIVSYYEKILNSEEGIENIKLEEINNSLEKEINNRKDYKELSIYKTKLINGKENISISNNNITKDYFYEVYENYILNKIKKDYEFNIIKLKNLSYEIENNKLKKIRYTNIGKIDNYNSANKNFQELKNSLKEAQEDYNKVFDDILFALFTNFLFFNFFLFSYLKMRKIAKEESRKNKDKLIEKEENSNIIKKEKIKVVKI